MLADNLKARLYEGQHFLLLGYASSEGHFRVTLPEAIANFGNMGYIYPPHVKLFQAGKEITYDPNALTLTVVQTTVIKKQPVDSSSLPDRDRATLRVGTVYGVNSYVMEAGHLKVALTENIPQFGNTGYVFPAFVELARGRQLLDVSEALTYKGPAQVPQKTPTILYGRYDARSMAEVELIAEDKYPLSVKIEPRNGTWHANLPQGFQGAGARWLRLQGKNAAGQVLDSKVIRVNVTAARQPSPTEMTVEVVENTIFKLLPEDASGLPDNRKVSVRAGRRFSVTKYGYVDGHLKLSLTEAIEPVGDFGFFFEGHVRLRQGDSTFVFEIEDVPDTEAMAQLLIKNTTALKLRPVDSKLLLERERTRLQQGKVFDLNGYASIAGHFRVTFARAIADFGNVGYLYWKDVRVVRNGKAVPYDPNAITLTVGQTTALKRRPANATDLPAEEKVTLPAGRVYGIAAYKVEEDNIKATFTEEFPGYGNTGYVFPEHVLMRRGGTVFDPLPPKQVELNVPYFSQRDNPRFYWSTCNVTSIAMVLYYYGERPRGSGQLEDEMLQWVLSNYGAGAQTQHNVLLEMTRDYGYSATFTTTRRYEELFDRLNRGEPFVLPGDFTDFGHIVTVIGYNNEGFIVNDPWGNALTGYTDTEGERLLYDYDYIDEVCGPDGYIWAHFIDRP